MPDADDIVEVEIAADLAVRLREAQQAYDEVAEYLQGLKDELKERYRENAKVVGTVNGERIFTYRRSHTTRMDSRALKKDWPDIYAQYATTSPTYAVTIARPTAAS